MPLVDNINRLQSKYNINKTKFGAISVPEALLNSYGLFDQSVIDREKWDKFSRFGYYDFGQFTADTKEYLFFVKPDLYIVDSGLNINTSLAGDPYFRDLVERNMNVVKQLQSSTGRYPFSGLLYNHRAGNLDFPSTSADMVDTPTTVNGTSYKYRWGSEKSTEGRTFSLDFRDSGKMEVYNFFKAYDQYETLKARGIIELNEGRRNKRDLYDQMAIYKIITRDDGETILWYGVEVGVVPTSVPDDTFSNTSFDGGIKYSVDFESAFHYVNEPWILGNFNKLMLKALSGLNPRNPYNKDIDGMDNSFYSGCTAAVEKKTGKLKLIWY